MSSDSGAATGADVGALTQRLQVLRSSRIADDREGDEITSVLRAIALTRRSRDAGISKGLREHRAHLEQAWADAEDLVMAATEIALLVRLRGSDDTVTRRACRAIEQSQQALTALVEAVRSSYAG